MTGPESAASHGNDSSDWPAGYFDAVQNLAAIDAQPAWKFIQDRLQAKPATPTQPTTGHQLAA